MNSLLAEFKQLIETHSQQLLDIPEVQTELPGDGGWSAKQILGHLIDSAANNHRRFVQAQFQNDLVFEGYDQEQWVRAQHYDQASWAALVDLWTEYNLHLLHVISFIPEAELKRPRHPHTLDRIAWQPVAANESATLEYLIQDYLGHAGEHLAQIVRVARAG